MLQNLVGVVTGGASGLGKATVKRLVSQGCKIFVCDLQQEAMKDLNENSEDNDNVVYIPMDVRKEEEVKNKFRFMWSTHKKLNFIVNCAGIGTYEKSYCFDKESKGDMTMFRSILETNLIGTMNVVTTGVELIAKNGLDENGQSGVIITTAGIEAFDGQIGQSMTAASSGAIAAMTLPLAREYGSHGVRVVCICPGLMDTPYLQRFDSSTKSYFSYCCTHPRRLGFPDEYAHTVQHIIQNAYINGSNIRLDGGLRLYFA